MYKSNRLIDGKPKWVIVNESGEIVNRNPSKDELRCLENELYEDKPRNKYTDKELLEHLRRSYEKTGKIPIEADFKSGSPNYNTYVEHFGNWGRSLKAAGLIDPYIEDHPNEITILDSENKTSNYNPNSKEFQEECKRLGLTGRQLTAKYQKEGKFLERRKKRSCCICSSEETYVDFEEDHWYRCHCHKENCTGYICRSCYCKNCDKYNPNSHHNLRKDVANRRTGNLDPNSNQAKGDKNQELACILYGWEDLNEKHDNYRSPLDCYDPKTGLYHQVRGRSLETISSRILMNGEESCYDGWSFSHLDREWDKNYETIVLLCLSKDRKIVERIYKFLQNIIVGMTSIKIFTNNPKYEKYRVKDLDELKKANEIWEKINNK